MPPELQPSPPGPRTGLRRSVSQAIDAIRTSISQLLRVSDARKANIYPEVFHGAAFDDLNYWLEIFFSVGIATLGLIISSPAVVIGAMLISPLIGPIVANGLALALGDFYLGIKSVITILLSIIASVALAALITWILPFRTPTSEILARVQPTLLDLGVAILSGAAGAVVVCRGGGGGGVTALPGVAVAVALMPPLSVVGFGVGIGWDWSIISGGGLLFLTNLVAIILTSFVVFFAVRLDTPAIRKSINDWFQKHEEHDEFYEFLERSPLRRLLGAVGTLPRRLLIMAIFVATVSLPLAQTLMRLRDEAAIRRAVFDEVRQQIPRDAVFREDLEISPEMVRLRVVAVMPAGFSEERRTMLEQLISRRAGRRAQVMVYDVATREEVSTLTGQMAARASLPLPAPVEQARVQLWQRMQPAINSAWPRSAASLLAYNLVLRPESSAVLVDIVYLADQDFGPLGEETLKKALREMAGSQQIETRVERLAAEFPLRFATGSSVLPAATRQSLDQAAAAMQRFPRLVLSVRLPSSSSLTILDTRHGAAVQQYLAEKYSLPAERVTVTATTGTEPVARLVAPPTPGG